ncbi:hypothetical protein CONCODRAFT_15274 [Conidiobolus coronatus NRRL 28638]|uniref:C2 domain-containing protein n=1 Tax=Conidiobolus coronatus (strain ATCC 28846 / CBS 209.66 / NRRL 28638) TaxID=796925 RepID=A0A137PFS9_CONC2|nr:hypothetical protein CONCODRAFT_15274 [Conidiobolus coronatus NRRL 28638]|eukprot:KXN73801.1 hypothetical protein CONCODRAFT_15274 [Conidiobolus coronatus NRRL 28638]
MKSVEEIGLSVKCIRNLIQVKNDITLQNFNNPYMIIAYGDKKICQKLKSNKFGFFNINEKYYFVLNESKKLKIQVYNVKCDQEAKVESGELLGSVNIYLKYILDSFHDHDQFFELGNESYTSGQILVNLQPVC